MKGIYVSIILEKPRTGIAVPRNVSSAVRWHNPPSRRIRVEKAFHERGPTER